MKTLAQHTLIYDKDCPLCVGYTQAFIRSKMLDKNGRLSYTEAINNSQFPLDVVRAKNEIALVNTQTYEVIYGIDSLLEILGHSWPLLKKIGLFPPIYVLLKSIYGFISYNRKVIILKQNQNTCESCTPTFHKGYRWLYIMTAAIITSLIMLQFNSLLLPYIKSSSWFREFLLCGGQLLFQGMILSMIRPKIMIHYFGHMMTVSLGGALLLLVLIGMNSLFLLPHSINLIAFICIVGLMFLEHKRRIELLQYPTILTWTWVLYRVLWLPILIQL